ncbi:hypothetical protein GCM10025862_39690 [Arsenicicoccus piscis]|uniref:Type II secretion system protein GspF domain-containing protein n=1 Tax=Arsenicicoccus piscis TaxID=673954 RepID=A0ABQ6HVQ0_9MICO|nr:hypothetical protein GCM10025862_01000 [Arsenicicoccus piscis]GMA21948.1 hypothetical protein GCM10025862_39690 [Arsenicicoccus piscis]
MIPGVVVPAVAVPAVAGLLVLLAVLVLPVGHASRLPPQRFGSQESHHEGAGGGVYGLRRRALGRLRTEDEPSVDAQVAVLVGLVAPGLAAGLDPWRAWAAAARASPGPVSDVVGQALARHGEVGAALRTSAVHDQSALLRRVVQMIELGEQLGTPLGGVLERAVQTFQAEEGARASVAAAAAGARSTGRLLLALTVAGPVIAAVLGLDVLDVYLGRPWVAAAALLGVLLALAGRWWLGLLAAAAARPRRWA